MWIQIKSVGVNTPMQALVLSGGLGLLLSTVNTVCFGSALVWTSVIFIWENKLLRQSPYKLWGVDKTQSNKGDRRSPWHLGKLTYTVYTMWWYFPCLSKLEKAPEKCHIKVKKTLTNPSKDTKGFSKNRCSCKENSNAYGLNKLIKYWRQGEMLIPLS